jgi:hypothetical protein
VTFLTSCAGAASATSGVDAPLAADTPVPTPPTAAPAIPSASPAVTPLPMDQLPPDAEAMVRQVTQDLAAHLGVPAGSITLLTAEAVTWPDASLGCPRPNTGYIQVETPGFRILLRGEGESYLYQTDLRENYLLCVDGQASNPSQEADAGEIRDGQPWMPVDPIRARSVDTLMLDHSIMANNRAWRLGRQALSFRQDIYSATAMRPPFSTRTRYPE